MEQVITLHTTNGRNITIGLFSRKQDAKSGHTIGPNLDKRPKEAYDSPINLRPSFKKAKGLL